MTPRSRPYKEILDERLKDHSFAREVLSASLEDDEPKVLMMAIRDVIRAQKFTVATVAKDAGLNVKSLHRLLNGDRSPNLATARALLNAIGYGLTLRDRIRKTA